MGTRRGVCCGLFVLFVLQAPLATADERSAADLLPDTTVVYVEIPQPAKVVEQFQDHPLRARIESLKGIREALKGDDYLQFKAIVSVIEARLGQAWPEIVSNSTGDGMALAIDGTTQGLGLLLKARDEKALPRIVSTLLELVRADARKNGKPDPIESSEYRGTTAYQLGDAKVASFGSWLLVTNKPKLGKAIIDSYLDKPRKSLARSEQFKTAHSQGSDAATAWAYVDVAVLREVGIAKEMFKGKTDNPVAEVIIGGLLDTLKRTTHATATLSLDERHARIELTTPHKHEWVSGAREYFFGPQGKGAAPALLSVKNELLSLSTYRDISTLWLRAGDLFDESTNDGFAEADATLSTLFSGKDFGEDVLGAVKPEVQLLVARQTYAKDQPQPKIKIPSFALVFRLKDPDKMKPDFRRTFQSLIGFINVTGAMNGQPQFDLDIDKDGDRQIVTASYVSDNEGVGPAGVKIHYNFSPSVAFVGDHFIVSSTKGLAVELLELRDGDAPKVESVNTAARADLSRVRDILGDNRGQLVAQNMLEEGNSKAEAESEIDDLLRLIAGVRHASLEVGTGDGAINVSFELTFSD